MLPRRLSWPRTWAALGGRSLARKADAMAPTRSGDLSAARKALPRSSAATRRLDADGICRATVESVAENTADAVVGVRRAPWPGRRRGRYRAANTLDAMIATAASATPTSAGPLPPG